MSFDSWTCISVERGGGIVPDELKCAIKMAACQLHLDKRQHLLFESEFCSGYITTTWDSVRLGGCSGILFSVELDSDIDKKTLSWRINFLLNTRDLEHGALLLEQGEYKDTDVMFTAELPFRLPIEQLYAFNDLRSRAMN